MIDCPHCIRKDAAIAALTDSRDRLADVRDRLAAERDHLRAELETAHAALRDFETGYKSLEKKRSAARREALEDAGAVIVGVLRRTSFWQMMKPQLADKIIEAVVIELRALMGEPTP